MVKKIFACIFDILYKIIWIIYSLYRTYSQQINKCIIWKQNEWKIKWRNKMFYNREMRKLEK